MDDRRQIFLLMLCLALIACATFVLATAPSSAQEVTLSTDDDVMTSSPRASCREQAPSVTGDPRTTSSLASRFVAAERFVENIGGDAIVKILWLGARFRQRFADKVEGRRDEASLRSFELRVPLRSRQIVTRLDETFETSLGDLWCLLTRQPAGEPGRLVIAGAPNLFYLRDDAGVLHMIDVVWGGAGWEIGASALDGSPVWPARARVFVR